MRNTLLAVMAAGLVGCIGSIDESGGTPTDPTTDPATDPAIDGVGGGGSGPAAAEARQQFETNVFPVLMTKCSGCHSSSGPVGNVTGFVGGSAANAYATAVGYQALVGDWTASGAPILLKIVPGTHQGTSYDQAQKDKIGAWLTKELESRAGNPDGGSMPGAESPAAATLRLTQEWSGCMTLANFQTAKMKDWGNMRANNSACKTCHINGEYGEIASDVNELFFTLVSTNKYYMAQYFSVDMSAGTASGKIIINTRSFTGVGTGVVPHVEHPRFKLEGSTGMAALQNFYDATVAAKTAGTCGPSTLAN